MIDKAPLSPEVCQPVKKKTTRVALWINEMSTEYLHAFRDEGIEIVALLQATHPDVPSFSAHDLFYGSPQLSAFEQVTAPAGWIDDASFREYALCVQRVGFFPGGKIMDTQSGGVFPASEIEDWARVHLNRALQLLKGVAADEVWFGFTPHLGVDNMLLLAASRAGMKCLVFEQFRFAPKFSCRCLSAESVSSTDRDQHQWQKWTSGAVPPNLFYMRKNLYLSPLYRNLRLRLCLLIRQLLAADREVLAHRLHLAARRRRWGGMTYLLDVLDSRTRPWALNRRRSQKAFERERKQRENIRALDDLGDFVYFPLQYEPEENVHIHGGRYRNQLDAVVAVHDALPPGWVLALKENPVQTYLHRGLPFLERLRNLDRVCFVRPDMSSQKLLARSRLVATITGTVGYESLLEGKACIHFGRAWYAGLPGAIEFFEGIDLAEVSARAVLKQELDNAFNDMLSGLADGLVHPRFSAIYQDSHSIVELYRQAAHSMSIISKSFRKQN